MTLENIDNQGNPVPDVQLTSVQPAAPSAPPVAPVTPQPTPAQSPAASVTPAIPQPTQATGQPYRSLSSRIFEGVLNNSTPQTPTRGHIGRAVLAGAIAGMFSGMGARDAQGRHDPGKAAAEGFQAATQMRERQKQLSDEDISRRQMVMKNNLDFVHQMSAMVHQEHLTLQDMVDKNNATILADAGEYDKNLASEDANDITKKAVQYSNLTYQEAVEKLGGKWDSRLAIVCGQQDVPDPATGEMLPEPRYALLNPNVRIQMSEKSAAEMARFNPAYKNIYKDTGGNVQVDLRNYVGDIHTLRSLEHMEAFFNQEKDELKRNGVGLKGSTDFAAMVREGGKTVIDAVKEAENALGHGDEKGSGDSIDALKRISGSGAGAFILGKLGITPDRVEDLAAEKKRKETLAGEGAGAKAPATSAAVAATNGVIAGIADPEIRKSLSAHLHDNMTNAELDEVDREARDQFNRDKEAAMKQGDPVVLGQVANRTIAGDLSTTQDLEKMFRAPYARANYDATVTQLAQTLGLTPSHYTLQTMKEKATLDEQYKSMKTGQPGAQLNSFDTFLYHNADAIEASNEWKRTNSRLWNIPMAEIEKNFGTDPTWIKFKASLIAPGKEFMNFLNSNRAEHEDDIKAANSILDSNLSPSYIYTALIQLARTADDRAAAMGNTYVGVVGTNFPSLLSANSLSTLKRMGIQSRAAVFSGVLPRNPAFTQNPSPQTLTELKDVRVAQRFAAAAGNDRNRAIEIAREHGWILR